MIQEKFIFSGKAKSTWMGISVVGVLLIIAGLFMKVKVAGHGGTVESITPWARFWANLLLSNFFFFAISILSIAFMAIQYLANGGWFTSIKRVFESISTYLIVPFVGFIVIIVASFAGQNHGLHAIYEWTNTNLPEVKNDVMLQGKSPYLNVTFFIIRIVAYFSLWLFFGARFRKLSQKEDAEGGIHNYNASVKASAYFLPVFGLTFCMAGWDWLMSIQPHWYSTMFSVNIFAGALVACMATVNIIVVQLKRQGYFSFVTDSVHHDVSKFSWAFSIFWTYTWLSQFLLIWYANLPEETPFYLHRLAGGWKPLFFLNLILNFAIPFLFYMMRESKRQAGMIMFVSIIMLIGKYTDWYLIIFAGNDELRAQAGFGPMELGFMMMFGGIFVNMVFSALAKVNLVANNHPFAEESLHHDI